MPVFQYKGTDIYYELYGKEGDPVITFCNGLSMRTSHWTPYFQMLPKMGVRVLAYDMLGQGFSSKPILGVDFEDHARSLKALHDHLGLKKPYIMGISFGGVVVLKYAAMYPDALKGLLPISTFSELDEQLLGHASNLYIGMARVGFEFYLDLLMPLNFTNEWMRQNKPLLDVIKRVGASSNELYGIQNLMESLSTFQSMTGELSKIKVPTLVMNGEFDALTPRHLHDIIRANIKQSRMIIIPKMCHAFTLEVPALTSRLFADFIHQVENGTWQGDQTVWVANEDPKGEPIAYPYPGDHLRFVPPADAALDSKLSWQGKKAAKKTATPAKKTVSEKPAARKTSTAKSPAKKTTTRRRATTKT